MRGPGNAVQSPDERVELSRMNAAREDTSLFHEIHETIRRLLQHIVFVSLLTLRLYMLPLLYISHKLATRDDPWYPASWNFVLYPGRTLAECACCPQREGRGTLARTWDGVRNGFLARLRIFKTLYSLGKIIGEDPNVLQPSHAQLLDDPPDSAIDVQSERTNSPKVLETETESIDAPLQAPASASQIYHAALINGSTLDDILAAFEAEENRAVSEFEPPDVHQSLGPGPAQSPQQQSPSNQYKGHRHQFSSIQTTPERMLMAPKNTEGPTDEPVQTGRDESPRRLQSPRKDEPRVTVIVHGENHDPVLECSPKSSALCSIQQPAARQDRDNRASTADLKRCPTFVRRQTQAHVSKRSSSGDRHSLGVLHDRGTVSSPALVLGSPTKRARLQRRVKVYQDPDKTVEA
jgi:hypothetical protein